MFEVMSRCVDSETRKILCIDYPRIRHVYAADMLVAQMFPRAGRESLTHSLTRKELS